MWERPFLTLMSVASNTVKAHDYSREHNCFLNCRLVSAWKSSQPWGPGLWCRQSFHLRFCSKEHSYTVGALTRPLSWKAKAFEVSPSDLCRRAGHFLRAQSHRCPLASGCSLLKNECTPIPIQLKIPVKNIDEIHVAVVTRGEIKISMLPRDPRSIPGS